MADTVKTSQGNIFIVLRWKALFEVGTAFRVGPKAIMRRQFRALFGSSSKWKAPSKSRPKTSKD